jgi:hypothetical protein
MRSSALDAAIRLLETGTETSRVAVENNGGGGNGRARRPIFIEDSWWRRRESNYFNPSTVNN